MDEKNALEERREIAAKLRALAHSNQGLLEPARMRRVMEKGVGMMGTSGLPDCAHVLERWADLMEPDATTFTLDEESKDGEEVYPTRWWRCARCGEETIMMYDEGEPAACPYCGAVVVSNDDASGD